MGPGCANCPVLKTSLFHSLTPEQIQRVGCVFRPARYRRNQILFFEGGSAQHLFALHAGLVKMVKSLENGKDRITGVLFPGELFGLESLTDLAYPITAVALRDCEICAAPREDFATYLQTNPDLAIGMVRFLVGELDICNVGGDGFFLATLTGPGKVMLQSMPIMNLAEEIARYLPGNESRGGGVQGDIVNTIFGN